VLSFGRRGLALSRACALVLASLLSIAYVIPASQAHAAEVSITLTCDGDVEFHANIGDTLVFTLAPPCDTVSNYNDGIYNERGINGTFGISPYPPGFLDPIDRSPDKETQENSWWRYAPAFPMRTILKDSTLGGATLSVGGTVAAVFLNNFAGYDAIRWMGASGSGGSDSFGGSDSENLSIWNQAYARQPGEKCLVDFSPSWAQWPSAGLGGWVCVRQAYVYYPDRRVQ